MTERAHSAPEEAGQRETVVIISPFPPPADGIGAHTANIAAAIDPRTEVVIIAPGDGGSYEVELGGRTVTVVRCLQDRRTSERVVRERAAVWVYCQFAISALHMQTFTTLRLLRSVKQLTRVVVGFHEPSREIPALPVIAKIIYRAMVKVAHDTVVYSDVAKAALVANCGSDPHVVPHGTKPVDAEREIVDEIIRRHGGPMVLALGFIHRDKGADVLVDAVRILRERGISTPVVIAGSPRVRTGIFRLNGRGDRRHLAQLRGAVERDASGVEFVPYVPDKEMAAYITAAAVSVLPYRNGAQSGIASLTIAAGRGAVVSDLPGMHEQFKAAARYVPVGDADALADAIQACLDDGTDGLDAEAQRQRDGGTYEVVARRLQEIGAGSVADPLFQSDEHLGRAR